MKTCGELKAEIAYATKSMADRDLETRVSFVNRSEWIPVRNGIVSLPMAESARSRTLNGAADIMDLACDSCGYPLVEFREVLLLNPPVKRVACAACGWSDCIQCGATMLVSGLFADGGDRG